MSGDKKEQDIAELEEEDNEQREMSEEIQSEELQTSSAASNLDEDSKPSVSKADDISSDDETKKEIDKLTDQLYSKMKKYKTLYNKEKDKNDLLVMKRMELEKSLEHKEAEIEKLKQELSVCNEEKKSDKKDTPSKRKGCNNCDNCRKSNCRNCRNCKDMVKYGGPGILKQSCVARHCLSFGQSTQDVLQPIPSMDNNPAVSNSGPNMDDISSGMAQMNLSASDIQTSASSVHEERPLDDSGEPTETPNLADEDSKYTGSECNTSRDDDKNI